jgi:hypothetical protein
MFCYTYLHKNVVHISYKYSVPSLLLISTLGSFFAAATYGETVNGVSVLLYISCAIGGSVGSLSSVIFNPFMTIYESNMITAARSGGSALILLAALIAIGQGPGTVNRFSVSVYLTIFGVLLIFPILSYLYIQKTGIGLRNRHQLHASPSESTPIRSGRERESSAATIEMKGVIGNPMNGQVDEEGKNPFDLMPLDAKKSQKVSEEDAIVRMLNYQSDNVIDRYFDSFLGSLVPLKWHNQKPWLRRAMPYIIVVGWIEFHTW